MSVTSPAGTGLAGAAAIVFVRHGRTAFNAQQRLQGRSDIELDDVGRWQALLGAQSLAAHITPDAIVASSLSRAAATAQILSEVVGLPVTMDDRLQERGFGRWEGRRADELAAEFPAEWADWRQGIESPAIGVEPREVAAARASEAIIEHAAAVPDGGTLVVVSHGALITVAISALLGCDPAQWRGVAGLSNVHWSRVERSGTGIVPQWRLTDHNRGPAIAYESWISGTA